MLVIKLQPLVSALVLSLLAGCALGPITGPTAHPAKQPLGIRPVQPPLPAGVVYDVKRAASRSVLSFQPAGGPTAVVPDEPRPVYIFPYGPGYYGVIGVQTNVGGGTLEFLMHESVTGPGRQLSTPFWVGQGETMMVMIPSNWQPDLRLFVNVKSVQGPAPAAAAARAVAEVDSGKVVKFRGKTYRLIRVSAADAGFAVFKLKL